MLGDWLSRGEHPLLHHRYWFCVAQVHFAILAGQQTEILDDFPEFGFYRDIVFMFKFMMTPSCEALPDIQRWTQKVLVLNLFPVGDLGMVLGCPLALELQGRGRLHSQG